jgi:hypothetical protein
MQASLRRIKITSTISNKVNRQDEEISAKSSKCPSSAGIVCNVIVNWSVRVKTTANLFLHFMYGKFPNELHV